MKPERLLDELTEAAQQLGLEVRQEKGNFRGGRCTVGGETLVMLNKRHLPPVRFAILAEALRDAPLDSVYLKPAVRKALEEAWDRQDEAAGPAPNEAAADAEAASAEPVADDAA